MSGNAPHKRASPFCIRLSPDERARLEQDAGELALGTYAKAKIFGGPDIRHKRTFRAVEDKQALAKALALLGQSRLASNVNQLAKAVHSGSLPVCPETEADIQQACAEIAAMRQMLVCALGLRPSSSA